MLQPHDRQQISNLRRSTTGRDKNVLYSVMLECKTAQGSDSAYVRDVKAAPSPQCVLFFDWQLQDMARFLTNNQHLLQTPHITLESSMLPLQLINTSYCKMYEANNIQPSLVPSSSINREKLACLIMWPMSFCVISLESGVVVPM